MNLDLTQQRLKEVLNYNPETGVFVWIKMISWRAPVGRIAGLTDAYGRTVIGIDGKRYFAHRLAWLYMHGRWPHPMIDHINGNNADNRFCNLRECNMSQNQGNRRMKRGKKNAHLPKGVAYQAHADLYIAEITKNGRKHYLGHYHNPDDAHDAYMKAARALQGEFARAK